MYCLFSNALLILSVNIYFRYDDEADQITSYQKVALPALQKIEIGKCVRLQVMVVLSVIYCMMGR